MLTAPAPEPAEAAFNLGISEAILVALIGGLVAFLGAYLSFRAEMEKLKEQSRESERARAQAAEELAVKAGDELRDDFLARVTQLEADRDRLQGEVTALHSERIYDSYVRAYATLLVEVFPDPPGAPPPPPLVAKALGLPTDPLTAHAPDVHRIRDPTKE